MLYWIAKAYHDLGDFEGSKYWCEQLLKLNSTHKKGRALSVCIEEKLKAEESYHAHCIETGGMGCVSAAFAVAAYVAYKRLIH